MSGSTYIYRDRDYPRVADCCGVVYNVSKLVKKADGLYYCPEHRKFQVGIDLSRQNARAPVIKVLPRKDPKVRDNINIYRDREGELLRLVCEHAPYRYIDVTNGDGARLFWAGAFMGVLCAAESIRALYDMIVEGKRPLVWITEARAAIPALAEFLLYAQFGGPYAASTGDYNQASTETVWGAFAYNRASLFTAADPITIYSEEVAAGGLAMVYAYNLTGDRKYLTSAKMAATCLRRMQCGDLLATKYATQTDLGTDRYHVGMWTHSMTFYTSLPS